MMNDTMYPHSDCSGAWVLDWMEKHEEFKTYVHATVLHILIYLLRVLVLVYEINMNDNTGMHCR